MKNLAPRTLVTSALIALGLALSLTASSLRATSAGSTAAGEDDSPTTARPRKGGDDPVRPSSQCSSLSFSRTDYAAETFPTSVAVGDFNGDNKPDLAAANAGSNTVSVLPGTGAGGFGAPANFATGAEPASVAVGDFNGDNKSDLVTANQLGNTVSVLLGDGAGSFGAAADFAVGTSPVSVAVGDFNSDGKADLATANAAADTVSVLLGTGAGTFGAGTSFAVGSTPGSVAVGDFNNDGKADLAAANIGSGVSVLLGDGAGGFSAATNFAVEAIPVSVATADLNGDGKLDLAVVNSNSDSVSVLLGTGTGGFGAAQSFAVGIAPYSVAVGDINGDGKLDLAVADSGDDNASVLLGTGTGAFGTAQDFATGAEPLSIVVADFDGDGKLDMATANEDADNVSVLLNTCAVQTITVGNANDSGAGSLRQAILDANAQAGVQTITFNIGTGLQTINLLSGLPAITDAVVIDGTTQPGYAGAPIIELNGQSAAGAPGLHVAGGESTIKGLVIRNFNNNGINLHSNNNVVQNCYIGTTSAGTAAAPNHSGIHIRNSSGNVVGGTTAAARNVISGNSFKGISIENGASNVVQGNYIGTNAAGLAALGNAQEGLFIYAGSTANLIGGVQAGARNVISGNSSGVNLQSDGNTVSGNYIGLSAAGTAAIPNSGTGISLHSANNFIGGVTNAGNAISGNGAEGIFIAPCCSATATGNTVQGNLVGTNAAGTAAVPNGGDGIRLLGGANNNTIGGVTAAVRNVISGNNLNGIAFGDAGTGNNVVLGNYIGTDITGAARVQNQLSGVVFGNNATNNTVGGAQSGAGNVISGNNQSGITIGVFGSGPGGGITVQGNLIGTNAAGTAALANGGFGVFVNNTPNNVIGGAAAGAGNVIAGNAFNGVQIEGASATGNTVAGNYIGTNAAGTAALGGGTGVNIINGANNNTVGGTTAAARNVISGTNGNGVGLGGGNSVATNNRVQGNYIGLNAAGTAVVANAFSGVGMGGTGATNNLIGGTAAGAGNVIAGNGHQAVAILAGASSNTVQGNFMGTDATGNTGLGGEGVFIGGGSSNNLIGGTAAGARNVISGNTGAAVSINDFQGGGATGNRVEGNLIGVNPAGTAAVPNGGGVVINNVSGNTVGGTTAGAGNVIANNIPYGVQVNNGSGNAVLSNSIFNNGNSGIGLLNGANGNQAAPVLTSAMNVAGTTTVTGTLNSTPGTNFTVQFFASAACDSSGSGEGQLFLGSQSVTTDGAGAAPLSFQTAGAAAGQVITATATSSTNNTSQFSACRAVTGQTVTISGRVTNGGAGVPDVTVTVSGAGTQTLQTDANGNYSFSVPTGGTYTVIPTSPYFVFTPLRADFPNVAANVTADFAVVPAATPTPTPPLQDDFSGAQRDPDKWNLGTLSRPAEAFDQGVTVAQQSGQLTITPRDNSPRASFNGYVSVKSFDFTGGQATVEAVKAAGGGAETAFSLGSDAENNYRFAVLPAGAASPSVKEQLARQLGGWRALTADMPVLVFQVKIGGVVTQEVVRPYDPAQHRYWRFNQEGPSAQNINGAVVFKTSPDNVSYTERFRKGLEKTVGPPLAVELTAGTAAPATGTTGAVFDNLSLVSASAQFSTDVLGAGEGDGRIRVTVTRSGNVAGGPATLVYRTEDSDTFTVGCADAAGAAGAAYARCDFATTVGTLQFAAGETSKSFTVPLIDDGHVEGPETFDLKLVSAAGAALGAPGLIRVTIRDNDAAGAPNPVASSVPFFVRQQYLDFLSREPDEGGFNAWTGVLDNCPNIHTDPKVPSDCDRIFVSGEGFFRSVEFSLKGAYVFRFYKVAFGRLPEYLEVVADMSFVAGSTAEEVYARRAELATLFAERQEFKAAYGGRTNGQYVADLLARYGLSQVTAPDPANPDTGAKVTLTAAQLALLPRDRALRAVADSDEVTQREFDAAFVAMQYYGYLRRKPEAAGYEAWLGVLKSGDTRTMVNGFLNSAEYKLRFGQP
jgi:hypothetical protein